MKEIISYGRFRCAELSPHKNRGMEITYIAKGDLEWMVEGRLECVPPGSVFFTMPWQVHGSLKPRMPDNEICHVLFRLKEAYPKPRKQIEFPAAFGFSKTETRTISAIICTSTRHCFRATPTMRWLIQTLISDLQGGHLLGDAYAISLLRAVIVELVRIVSGKALECDIQTPTENRVQKFLNRLPYACAQPWTLQQMAETCEVKRTQFTKLVRKITGCSPFEYLARLRIERAKTLLRESDLKIIDIAFECGFSSSQYFSNTFRRATGLTPTEFREQCTGPTGPEEWNWQNIGFRSVKEELERIKRFSGK